MAVSSPSRPVRRAHLQRWIPSTFRSGAVIVGFLVLAAAIATSVRGHAACPRELRQPAPLSDRRETYDCQMSAQPEAAAAAADAEIARDEHDLAARWARGVLASRRDSVVADAAVARAASSLGHAGEQIEGGTVLFTRGRVVEGRAAYDHARDAYLALGRSADAANAVIWKARRSLDAGDRSRYDADLIEADSLARRSADADVVADVALYRTERALRSDYALAMRLSREALALLAPLGASSQLTYAHRSLAFALLATGAHDSARVHYAASLEISRAREDTLQMCRGLAGLGNVNRIEGRYPQARARLEEVLALALRTGNFRQIVGAYHGLGTLLDEMGYPLEALDHLNEGLRRMREAKWVTDNEAVMLETMGGMEGVLGRFEAAREHLEQALALCRARNIRTTESFVLQSLADLHRMLGEPELARRLVDEGLAAAKASGQKRVQSMLLSQKARVMIELGEPDSALAVARQGKALAAEVEPRNVWYLARDEATALGRLDRPLEGVAVLESTRTRFLETRDSLQYARTLQLQGALLLRAERNAPALEVLERALAIAAALGSPAAVADAHLSLGPALLANGRPRQAIAVLEPGLAWFEGVQSAVRASEERSAYQSRWHDGYVALARAYARSGQPERAFATLERSRAREMRRLFARKPAALRSRVPPALARELDRTESRLTQLQASLLSHYELPPARRPASLAALERRVDSLQATWSALNRRAQREATVYARELGLVPAFRAREVRQSLRPEERLIAFMVGEQASLAFDFHNGRMAVRELSWGEEALATRVDRLIQRLRGNEPRAALADAAALADTLLGPSRAGESPARVVYVVPDAALHYLPFETLRPGGTGRTRHYLIEQSEVIYAPSATLLFRTPVAAASTVARSLVAFGDPALNTAPGEVRDSQRGALPTIGPLPFARREVMGIQALFPKARVFVGDQATESRFFVEAADAPILHVAAHAFVDDTRPEFSGIVLAPTPGRGDRKVVDDGLVQAFEVLQHRYRLELATLSACETGRGRLLRGEGLVGLSRAFRLAGARSLLVSLWKVDDAATADFMAEFYRRLRAGDRPAAALRGTKLTFLTGAAVPAAGVARGDSAAWRSGAHLGAGLHATLEASAPEPAPADSSAADGTRGIGRHRRADLLRAPPVWAAFVLHGSR